LTAEFERLINKWMNNDNLVGKISFGFDGLGKIVAIESEETLKMTKDELFEFVKKQDEPVVIEPNFFKGGISSVKVRKVIK